MPRGHEHIPFSIYERLSGRSDLFRFALLNTRSIRKKAMFLKDYVVENQIDLLAITETWLDLKINRRRTL